MTCQSAALDYSNQLVQCTLPANHAGRHESEEIVWSECEEDNGQC